MRVYTDASTRGGISGLGYVATTARDKELYSHGITIDQSDNNTAELLAIIYAIDDTQDLLQKNEKVTILTDSTYAIQAIRFNNYRKNEEAIVKKIQNLMEAYDYTLFHVKGHCQDGTVLSHFNKKADRISKNARKDYENEKIRAKKERVQMIKKNRSRE